MSIRIEENKGYKAVVKTEYNTIAIVETDGNSVKVKLEDGWRHSDALFAWTTAEKNGVLEAIQKAHEYLYERN